MKKCETEGAHGEGGGERMATSRDPRVSKLTDADDIEVTFERLMSVYDVPANRWVFKLALLNCLVSKLQSAPSATPVLQLQYESYHRCWASSATNFFIGQYSHLCPPTSLCVHLRALGLSDRRENPTVRPPDMYLVPLDIAAFLNMDFRVLLNRCG